MKHKKFHKISHAVKLRERSGYNQNGTDHLRLTQFTEKNSKPKIKSQLITSLLKGRWKRKLTGKKKNQPRHCAGGCKMLLWSVPALHSDYTAPPGV